MPSSRPENGNEAEDAVCHFLPEEKLVDYVMNRLPESERAGVAVHAATCSHCAERLQEWEQVMQLPELEGFCLTVDGVDGSVDDGHHIEVPSPERSLIPPARMGRKLRMRAYLRSAGIWFARNRRFILPGAASAAVAVFLLAGLFSMKQQVVPSAESIDGEVSSKIAVMQSAAYEQYPISPMPPMHGSGGVWINRNSGELLIVVDGLKPTREKDYQIWLQQEQQPVSDGMLLTRNSHGKGYYYGYGPVDPDQIVISLEPKGGSHVQTGPVALRIKVNGQQ
ncbi:anti-sigma factor [Paenibacillus sp. KQZ6P-2]|uniref:Anti-sigma factor n=1 Tax=Paenibacillus mangrovi TaxID=2931978 RepID=A0A9X2B2Y2_9BACL|nr:anti-sigma factor [Paenibacillus mangrovi]MCJ8012375.1 anti-sigma factor [Paenibacillus mangrovi]